MQLFYFHFFLGLVFVRQEHRFRDFERCAPLGYLADSFSHLNGLNLGLEGNTVTMCQNNIEATIKKIDVWARELTSQTLTDLTCRIFFPSP